MSMATIRISEAEAIRDIAGLLARAYRGEEIVIEKDATPSLVLRTIIERPMRRLLGISTTSQRAWLCGHARRRFWPGS